MYHTQHFIKIEFFNILLTLNFLSAQLELFMRLIHLKLTDRVIDQSSF